MKIARRMILLVVVLVLVVVSASANGEWLRLTTGVSGAFKLWQTPPPPTFGSATYWGGLGIGILYRSISFEIGVTLADLETLRIAENPAISLDVALTLVRFGAVSLNISAGPMFQTNTSLVTMAVALGASWDVLPFTTVKAWIGYETLVTVTSGSCIYVGVGTSVYLPLL